MTSFWFSSGAVRFSISACSISFTVTVGVGFRNSSVLCWWGRLFSPSSSLEHAVYWKYLSDLRFKLKKQSNFLRIYLIALRCYFSLRSFNWFLSTELFWIIRISYFSFTCFARSQLEIFDDSSKRLSLIDLFLSIILFCRLRWKNMNLCLNSIWR